MYVDGYGSVGRQFEDDCAPMAERCEREIEVFGHAVRDTIGDCPSLEIFLRVGELAAATFQFEAVKTAGRADED